MELATVVGLIGAVAYLAGYALIQMRILSIDDGRYAALNVLGGVALIYSLLWSFNLGSFLTQVAWLIFTIVGYFHSRHHQRKAAAASVVLTEAANDTESVSQAPAA
ncbi:CBU_0592 family membrane protein [Devosia aquimaris]|uniref:CBU_0592 family membrane protein n=1 Tax=Devosia aquimaris TaxID=2866214 RepID=UPI001CD16B40|nr:cyclic nucleotide-binding protein [Devosia sp. CJK-A8-3]